MARPLFLLCLLLLAFSYVVTALEGDKSCVADGANNNDDGSSCLDETQLAALKLLDSDFEWGVEQEIAGEQADEVRAILLKTKLYMMKHVRVDSKFDSVRDECKNRDKLCAFWAAIGECEANPQYMILQCAPVCQSCDLIDFDTRCPYDPNAPTILNPGDLNKVFERLTTDPYYQQYEPKIHSQPDPIKKDDDEETPMDGPWVVTLEKFLTPEECERLIDLGAAEGYKRSSDVGEIKFDGTYDSYVNNLRTSTNAWCTKVCYQDPLVKQVLSRIENVTGIPDANSEYLQMLRYEVGQFYQQHHDYIEYHNERAEGVRILTVFLYLNDVDEGGGTNFPKLGLTVMPKQGKVLIWPSVLNENPNAKDFRTDHQALPVEKGVKYGANAWLHQRDFKEAYDRGCT